jgi:hypothetical protein
MKPKPDFANSIAIRTLQGEDEFNLRRDQLKQQHDEEIAQADKTGADKFLIDKKYAAALEKLDKEQRNSRLKSAADMFGQLSELTGKQTAIGKAAAVAQATINTYLSATEAYSALAGIPVVGPALGAAAAALAVATGLMNVKQILSTDTPKGHAEGGVFEHDGYGGLLPGYSKYDNINAKLRGGEGIIVSEAMQDSGARNLVSAVNVAYGGRAFAGATTNFLNDGGALSRQINTENITTSGIVEGVKAGMKTVTIVTDVKDVILETQKRVQLTDNANL